MEVLRRHKHRVLTFHRDIPTRFGLLPRHGRGDEVRIAIADFAQIASHSFSTVLSNCSAGTA